MYSAMVSSRPSEGVDFSGGLSLNVSSTEKHLETRWGQIRNNYTLNSFTTFSEILAFMGFICLFMRSRPWERLDWVCTPGLWTCS